MKTERLLTLAQYLDQFMPSDMRKFDLNYWGWNHSCGIVCCAMGLASEIPELRKDGLRAMCEISEFNDNNSRSPVFEKETGWDATRNFFGISPKQSYYLFSSDEYEMEDITNPKTVARRIRQFVKSGGKVPSR